MQVLSAASNWQLTIRREADHIVILRAATCDAAASLPDELFGLPVTALGDRALAPGAADVPGELLLLTCGPADFTPDNRHLHELTLPANLTDVGNYAFFNCRELQVLNLHDRVTRWGAGCLMNCRELDTLRITRDGEAQGESLAFFAASLSRQLDVTLYGKKETSRLLFPEYLELYEENSASHHFDLSISGAGYPYHAVFRGKDLHFADYDALWDRFLSLEHREEAALLLAWYRLRWPVELSEKAENAYRDYLASHIPQALRMVVNRKDLSGLQYLLDFDRIPRDTLAEAQELCRTKGFTEASALLLEEQHRRFPAARRRSFDL